MENQMPEPAYRVLSESLLVSKPLHINDFSSMLHYKLLQEKEKGFSQYLDVSSDLSDRIRNNLYQFNSFLDFCDLLKSKDMTYTRISRCLLHILLNLETSFVDECKKMDFIPYARVLGFRKDAQPLLSAIKEKASIPMITKLADAEDQLDKKALLMLKNEIRMNDIYLSAAAIKAGKSMPNEYSTPIVII